MPSLSISLFLAPSVCSSSDIHQNENLQNAKTKPMNNSKTGNATKFDSVRDMVFVNLTKHPYLRDNDSKLIATIWFQQLGKDQIYWMTAMDFLQTFADRKLHNTESIRRMRQKLQEQYPHLRGASYQHRKNLGVQTRKTIHHV